jgi:glycogen debranching enzyme
MDSLDRSGANIEIQALRLSIYEFAYRLFRKLKYKNLLQKHKKEVLAKFYKNKILLDNLDDQKIRPNVFIAAYVYPELLKKKQWSNCFEIILPKLWLDWGGLSTLDITDQGFVDRYTGQNPSSYHCGDSWFWINNLAAKVLHRTNRLKFNIQINKILQASTQEILWQGIVGHHAELSSASEFKSEGCWSQAWSAALYLELVKQILGH